MSPSSDATPSNDGRLAPGSGTVTSPVGGLVILGTTSAWVAKQVASSSDGCGSSSGQHSFTSTPLQLDATDVAAAAGYTPQAGPCSTCAAAHQPQNSMLPEGCVDAGGAS